MEFITYLLLGAGLVILGEAVCLTIIQYVYDHFDGFGKKPAYKCSGTCSDKFNCDNSVNDSVNAVYSQNEEDVETPSTYHEVSSDLPKTQFDQTYDERITQFKQDLLNNPVSKTPPAYTSQTTDYPVDDGVEIITERYEKEFEQHNKI